MDQNKTPLASAIEQHIQKQILPFHVPAHKQGRLNNGLKNFLGEFALQKDLNALPDIDDLGNPISVIKEAQKLAAKTFSADDSSFLINGTSSGIHMMMLASLNPGDFVIMPRNCHKSAFSGLILSGAIPVYTDSYFSKEWGTISNMTVESVKKCFHKKPNTKAIMILNPTYYGHCTDIQNIIKIAHKNNALVLADEAHGCCNYFNKELPIGAMQAKADISAISVHKTGGSLTQSSLLVYNNTIDTARLHQCKNLLNSTSASFLLMGSLDIARHDLALYGQKMTDYLLELTSYCRLRLQQIPGIRVIDSEIINPDFGCYQYDLSKIIINFMGIGLTGFTVEKILREKYNIQIELADHANIMPLISYADSKEEIDSLIHAIEEIAKKNQMNNKKNFICLPNNPEVVVSPRDAFYAPKETVTLKNAINRISGEMIMTYPPGIPVICPGELFTKEIYQYVKELKKEYSALQGPIDPEIDTIQVLIN